MLESTAAIGSDARNGWGIVMAYAFNARKASQVIAFFILKSGRQNIDVLKAIKLVYLSDRESVTRYGFPILDEDRVSMPQGPVNSMTYRHVSGEYDLDACGWSEFLEDRADHQIGVARQFLIDDLDELSDADVICLDSVWSRFGQMTKWEIRDWTHDRRNVPEWEDPNGSSRPIPLERMMAFLGIENADEQADVVNDYRRLDALFASISAGR